MGEVVVDGVDTGLFDDFRRVEVGFADAEADHIDASFLHFAAPLAHAQGGRGSHFQYALC